MSWYYADKDKPVGPIEDAEWQRLVEAGRIAGDTLVWREGMANWQAYAELAGAQGEPPPVVAALSARDSAAYSRYEFGGFWIRFAAKVVDGLILTVPFMILFLWWFMPRIINAAPGATQSDLMTVIEMLFIQVAYYGLATAYNTFFIGRFAATPGKMLCRLKVIRSTGEHVTYLRACGRFLAEILSGMIFYIGYIIAAFDEEKRTLHDHICDTRVVKL